jgi:hypothetical protein
MIKRIIQCVKKCLKNEESIGKHATNITWPLNFYSKVLNMWIKSKFLLKIVKHVDKNVGFTSVCFVPLKLKP